MRLPQLCIFALTLLGPSTVAAEPGADTIERQRRAMLEAGEKGDAATVYRLISAGAPVDVTDEAQRTPLFMAVTANKLDVVRQLLAEGANVNARANDRATPWLLAADFAIRLLSWSWSRRGPGEYASSSSLGFPSIGSMAKSFRRGKPLTASLAFSTPAVTQPEPGLRRRSFDWSVQQGASPYAKIASSLTYYRATVG